MSELWDAILTTGAWDIKRADNYPSVICAPCGKIWGRRECGMATWHIAKCGICGDATSVTEPRDFGHLRDGWQR